MPCSLISYLRFYCIRKSTNSRREHTSSFCTIHYARIFLPRFQADFCLFGECGNNDIAFKCLRQISKKQNCQFRYLAPNIAAILFRSAAMLRSGALPLPGQKDTADWGSWLAGQFLFFSLSCYGSSISLGASFLRRNVTVGPVSVSTGTDHSFNFFAFLSASYVISPAQCHFSWRDLIWVLVGQFYYALLLCQLHNKYARIIRTYVCGKIDIK